MPPQFLPQFPIPQRKKKIQTELEKETVRVSVDKSVEEDNIED